MSRAMTEPERAFFQDLVMRNYERFVGIVSAARGVSVDLLRAGVADGRVVLGEAAVAEKLADEVGYVEAAYEAAQRLAGVDDAEVVRYTRTPGWRDFLGFLAESGGGAGGGAAQAPGPCGGRAGGAHRTRRLTRRGVCSGIHRGQFRCP